MAFSNQTKNTGAFTNQSMSGSSITWDEATFTWDESEQASPNTWDSPRMPFAQQAKNTGAFSNQTKND